MPPRSRLLEGLALAAILFTFWFVRWPFRETVLIRDEGCYAYSGQRILQGEVPYRDIYDQKTPLSFYTMAAGQALFGSTVRDLRLFGSAYGLLTTSAVYALARSAFGPLAAAAAALSFVAMVFDQAGVLHQESTEYFMLLWLALAVLAWKKRAESAKPGWAAAAGVLAGLACLTKQSGSALLVFFAADALWRHRGAGRGVALAATRELLPVAVGFALALTSAVAFFASQGALADFVDFAGFHIGGYVGARYLTADIATRLTGIADIVGWDTGFWILGAFGLYRASRSRTDAASRWWLLLLVLLALAILPGRNSRHYFLLLVLPLALGIGALAHSLRQQRRARRVAFAFVLLLAWLGPLAHAWTLASADPDAIPSLRLRPFYRSEEVARAIAQRTEPGERILIVGSEPQIYYLAERPAATRLIHLYTATGPYPMAPALRDELIRDLREGRPRYVLLVNVMSSLTEFPGRIGLLLEPILEVLQSDYVVEERWDGPGSEMAVRGFGNAEFLLWRRRDG